MAKTSITSFTSFQEFDLAKAEMLIEAQYPFYVKI